MASRQGFKISWALASGSYPSPLETTYFLLHICILSSALSVFFPRLYRDLGFPPPITSIARGWIIYQMLIKYGKYGLFKNRESLVSYTHLLCQDSFYRDNSSSPPQSLPVFLLDATGTIHLYMDDSCFLPNGMIWTLTCSK